MTTTAGRKRRKRNLLRILIVITLLAFVILLGVFLLMTDGGIFDRIFYGKEEKPIYEIDSELDINIYAENNSYDFNIDYKEEECIFEFFRVYYGNLATLTEVDFSSLYTKDSDARVYDNALHDYLISAAKKSNVSMRFSASDVKIQYISGAFATDDVAEIVLKETFTTNYEGLSDIVSTYHEKEHFFVLNYVSDKWLINRHEDRSLMGKYYSDIFSNIIAEDGYIRSDITLLYIVDYIDRFRAALDENAYIYPPESDEIKREYEYPYNRDLAYAYTLDYTSRDRPIRNYKFATFNNNSVSFTSQAMNYGGIPMDVQGREIWKYYDDRQNSGTAKSGYSRSWMNAAQFYKYATENDGFGLVAEKCYPSNSQRGDIIQFTSQKLSNDGEPIKVSVFYQCMVTDNIDGELVLSANDDDLRNFPLSALGFNSYRTLKILGYNSTNDNFN